jgi:hypothetical protein
MSRILLLVHLVPINSKVGLIQPLSVIRENSSLSSKCEK